MARRSDPFIYFKAHYPRATQHVGALVGDASAAKLHWDGTEGAMKDLGYHIVYSAVTTALATDFTSQVLAMRQAGVQFLDITSEPVSDDTLIIKDLDQQNWHPTIIESGDPSTTVKFYADAGGAQAVDEAATDGVWLQSAESLFLGQDAASIPAVATFDHWVQATDPGFKTDLYALYGWESAELFVDALQAAGPHPTRGKVLAALEKVDTFNGGGLSAPSDPAGKVPSSCYILAKAEHGTFVRVTDPPHGGFRCDGGFYYAGDGR